MRLEALVKWAVVYTIVACVGCLAYFHDWNATIEHIAYLWLDFAFVWFWIAKKGS